MSRVRIQNARFISFLIELRMHISIYKQRIFRKRVVEKKKISNHSSTSLWNPLQTVLAIDLVVLKRRKHYGDDARALHCQRHVDKISLIKSIQTHPMMISGAPRGGGL